jgi:pimeloyl-ACP methyl ester carboxylesterase
MTDELVDVVSPDGTTLSARVTGAGTPLVLVHGTTGSKDSWALVEPLLAEHHTIWAYDRRGRGHSGDAADYAFDREVEDVQAVVAAAGEGTHLVGHSFGAYCSLLAAARTDGLRSLIVYEPPVHAMPRAEPIGRAVACLDANDYEGALMIFLTDVVEVSADEFALVRSIPELWDPLIAAAPTCRRELAALAERSWDPTDCVSIHAPTLHLSGSLTESPSYLSIDELRDAVPDAAFAKLHGQRHIAIAADPQQFAATVLSFTTRDPQ